MDHQDYEKNQKGAFPVVYNKHFSFFICKNNKWSLLQNIRKIFQWYAFLFHRKQRHESCKTLFVWSTILFTNNFLPLWPSFLWSIELLSIYFLYLNVRTDRLKFLNNSINYGRWDEVKDLDSAILPMVVWKKWL